MKNGSKLSSHSSELPTAMSCEQAYNLWFSEPEVIRFLDIRPQIEFDQGHIPGAVHLEAFELPSRLAALGDKLAIIVAHEWTEHKIRPEISRYQNFVFLGGCDRWVELQYPLASHVKSDFHVVDKYKGETLRNNIVFQQLFDAQTSTYTYILADKTSKEAAIIDAVLETVDRDIRIIEELGLKLIYAIDTHIHADHITGAAELKKRLGARIAVSQEAGVECADIHLEDGQELLIGDRKIKVIATPGHTNSCLSLYFEDMVFTGDALLIRSCGRTDFQRGSSEVLFKSVRERLFKLPDDTTVYPGHDYRGFTSSTIGDEKEHNNRLRETIGLDEFKKIMDELKLDPPMRIEEALRANMVCGRPGDKRMLHPQIVDGIPEISVGDLYSHLDDARSGKIKLIDVRRPEEFNNELGHVEGSVLVTLGPELTETLEKGDRSEEIVFICRSGGRSATATAESIRLGYALTINMSGGMLLWNEKRLPTVRDEN